MLAKEHKIRSIAFPAISTGVYRYPKQEAAEIAVRTVRRVQEEYPEALDTVVFVLFDEESLDIYQELLRE